MKMQLQVSKGGAAILTGEYDIEDAETFGKACADVWFRIAQQKMEGESSIGALMEHLDDGVLDQLTGAAIRLEKSR